MMGMRQRRNAGVTVEITTIVLATFIMVVYPHQQKTSKKGGVRFIKYPNQRRL
jgi:hypothetical protein